MSKILKSRNPYSGKLIAERNELTPDQVHQRIERSEAAFLSYRKSDPKDRKRWMLNAADILLEHSDEYADLITTEMGKLKTEAVAEVEKCAWVCRYYAEYSEEFLRSRIVETDAKKSEVHYQPLGPVLAVMPWNFPFWQVFRFASPALMAGNTGILKHASNVQGCAEAIESILNNAGFPEDVFLNLTIGSSMVEQVIAHKGVKAVTLTGSESAGSAVASLAGKHLKKSVLELGGNNAFVVLRDADLEKATDAAMIARLQNAGQSCIAAKRFIVEEEVLEPFLERLIHRVEKLFFGDPKESTTTIAPLFAEVQALEIQEQVKRSLERGARLVKGGIRKGAFYAPTILTHVEPGMEVFDQETFGPVFAITSARNKEDALELSNLSHYGLGMQLFTQSQDSISLFIEEAQEGAVFINGFVKSDPRLPFGGVKRSGYGRELSVEGIREFVNIKTVWKGSD